MTRTTVLSVLLPLSLSLAVSCAASQGRKVRDARMEQVEAQANAQASTIEQATKMRTDEVEKHFSDENKAVQSADQPGEAASSELVGVAKDRAVYASNAQGEIEKLGVRVKAAQEKINILGAQAPSSLQDQWQTVNTEYKSISSDVARLNGTSPDAWGDTKSQLETHLSTLRDNLKALDSAISGV